jgi:predicted acetyltransferase
MALKLRWVGNDELDRIAEARLLSYAPGTNDRAQYQQRIRDDAQARAEEFLLAERDGTLAGTATHVPLDIWVRGAKLPCQGVAYVGTVKTQRRKSGNEPGVGTAVMNEVLRAARDRGCVLSTLMPFRASYYEHFGYGIVERRANWTVPLCIIPHGDFGSIRFYQENDFDELAQCRNRIARSAQCDMERPPGLWRVYLKDAQRGFIVVDRDGPGPVRGWMTIENQHADGLDTIRVWWDFGYEDAVTLKRFLFFLSSLRDQYRFASLQLPIDVPLNLLLREQQVTHRASKNHPNAEVRQFTRMQARILDHKKLIESMRLPPSVKGKAVVAVHETEGNVVKFQIDVAEGKAAASVTAAAADVEFTALNWAMVVLGDLKATNAAELGLISVANARALPVLDVFCDGPAPYCREYF